jgi:hypothetical protein
VRARSCRSRAETRLIWRPRESSNSSIERLALSGLQGWSGSYQRMMGSRALLLALVLAAGATGIAPCLAGASFRPQGTPDAVLHLRRAPYVAVRCPGSNTIACDRVSIAAWPDGHPLRLIGTIAGRRVVMRLSSARYWEGTLNHAGLSRDGPLQITPDGGRSTWIGRHPRPVVVRLIVAYRGRPNATVVVHLLLRPGWG